MFQLAGVDVKPRVAPQALFSPECRALKYKWCMGLGHLIIGGGRHIHIYSCSVSSFQADIIIRNVQK